MAIKKNAAAPAAETAATPATLTLQLAKAVRLVEVNGPIYENHKAYKFSIEEAQRKLSMVDEQSGMPVWKVYRAPVKVEVESTPAMPHIVDASEAATVNDPEPGTVAAAAANVIEIGSDAELAELGLPPEGDVVQV